MDHTFKLKYINCDSDGIPERMFVVISDDYNIIAKVYLGYKNKKAAYIRSLFVRNCFRRKGIATLLINNCCCTAVEKGCDTIGVLVKRQNTGAITLYSKLEFFPVYEYEDDTILYSKKL